MYKAQSQPGGQAGQGTETKTGGESKPGENVVDAEFVDVEDKK